MLLRVAVRVCVVFMVVVPVLLVKQFGKRCSLSICSSVTRWCAWFACAGVWVHGLHVRVCGCMVCMRGCPMHLWCSSFHGHHSHVVVRTVAPTGRCSERAQQTGSRGRLWPRVRGCTKESGRLVAPAQLPCASTPMHCGAHWCDFVAPCMAVMALTECMTTLTGTFETSHSPRT
jgi:hypothetical protein